MKELLLFLLPAGLFLTLASQARAVVILNPSFETTTGNQPTDWNPTGNLAVVSNQGATDGSDAVAFSWNNQPSNGEIWQSFSTTGGTSYRLNFDFGKYSINQPNQSARLNVEVYAGGDFTGPVLLTQTVIDSSPGIGDPNSTSSADVYSPFQFNFSALGTTTTLRFRDASDAQTGGGGFDAMLDNVAVSEVPEPCVPVLLVFGAAMASGRRRRGK